jgi:hypothetical protein
MFITATMNSIESGTPIQAGMSSTPSNGKVTWSIQTPNMHGIEGRDELTDELHGRRQPAEVVYRRRRRWPTAAPSSTPLLSAESRGRRGRGTRMPRKMARPPSRGIGRRVDPPRVGPVDGAEHARHPADCRGQEDDDDERDDRPVEDLRRRPQLVEHCGPYFVPYRRSPASPRPGRM